MVIYLERGADLHMDKLMPLPLTASCFSKIQIGTTFLVLGHLGSPGQRAVKRVCVCVCRLSTDLLTYCDRCVVSRASEWLRSNPDVTARTCQTVTWSSHDPTSCVAYSPGGARSHDPSTLASPSGAGGELMVLSRGLADNSVTYHLRGLRYSQRRT